ncbi:hypothetical protein SOVF_122490 [Spinacia oleracea]|nr:hypothetical protein SOVF_122490 [Spinacia oleracea]
MSNIFTAASNGDLKRIKEIVKRLNDKYGEQKAKEILGGKDSKGRTILHIAASEGRTLICKYLVDTIKFDINSKDRMGSTPLHHAVLEGHFMTSSFLLDHGADPNATSPNGLTPLHYAAKNGRKDHVKLLISKGAEVDALSASRGTPLRNAAAYGMKDVVKILLGHKANSHADPNLCLDKPLVVAVFGGNIEIIKCLLRAGADPNVTNFFDLTPIEIAAMEGHLAVVETLFDATTPIPHIPIWSCHGICEYMNSQEAKNQRQLKAVTKFFLAKLIGAQAMRTNDYLTAAYWYTECSTMKPTDATMFSNRSFCWSGLNEADLALSDADSSIRLNPQLATGHYCAGIARMLLKDSQNAVAAFGNACKCDPRNKELRDTYKFPVHLVCQAIDEIRMFCPLNLAFTMAGRKDLVNLLITEGAAVDALSFTKGTPLLLAAAYSMKDAVKILLEHNANHGADPNLGYYGEKPLIFAVLKGRIDIIKCLLTAGAYTNATNFCDLTPIEIAAVEGNLEVLNILFDYTSRIPHIPIWSCHGIYEYINSQEAKNQAIRMKATDATVFCNRSLCFSCLNEGDPALFDAQLCINLSPDWFMGYYRAGIAYMMLKDFKNAAEAFLSALNRHPPNQELQDAYRPEVCRPEVMQTQLAQTQIRQRVQAQNGADPK